jgi:hypothetical protein
MSTPDKNLFPFPYDGNPVTDPLYPADFDISYLLPQVFRTEEFWSDLLTSTAAILDEFVHAPLAAMANIRIPEAQSRIYKALNANMMGFEIKDSLMTDDGYDRLNNNVGNYLYEQGKDNFVCFLGYILGIKLSLVRLWTEDYVNFLSSPGKTVFEGGSWYPTTHVGLIYDSNPNTNQPLPTEQELTELFYKHAPIDLVLKWIGLSTTIMMTPLYIQLLSITHTESRFYVDARGDLKLNMSLQILDHQMEISRNNVVCPGVNNKIYSSAALVGQIEATLPSVSTIALWNKDIDVPKNMALTVKRATQNAWKFTGVGQGTWVPGDTIRQNVDPSTGIPLGILLEPNAQNYVRSSTQIGKKPWRVNGEPGRTTITAGGMDGEDVTLWAPLTTNDNVSQTLFLPKGQYTAQIVYQELVPPVETFMDINIWNFAPLEGANAAHIDLLGSVGSIVETGIEIPGEEILITYPVIASYVFTSTISIGGGWVLGTTTFTLTDDATVNIVLPIATGITFFYAGIEPGAKNTSFIYTDDCRIGFRAEDLLYIATAEYDEGTIAFTASYADYTNQGPVPLGIAATEALMYDSDGKLRLQVNAGPMMYDPALIVLTDYPKGSSLPINTAYPLTGSNPEAVTPVIYFTWSGITDSGLIGVNGGNYGYTSQTMQISLTRVGPGWYGHVTAAISLPVPTDATTIHNLLAL